MTRRIVLAIALICFATVAMAKPNFTGSWKINASKSKSTGDFPLPQKFDRKIAHADPSLQVSTTQSGFQGGADRTTELKYTTDGKEVVNQLPNGEAKGTAKWDGDVLVVESTRKFQDNEIKQVERWSLSADGKTLEIENKISGGFGDFEMKYVLDKQ